MIDAANRLLALDLHAALLTAEAEALGYSVLEHWAQAVRESGGDTGERMGVLALRLVESRTAWKSAVAEALDWLPHTADSAEGIVSDASEDKAAWEAAVRAIRSERGGGLSLGEFLQEMALRPKEPPKDPEAVNVSTIHAAKGLEFDYVWIVGMAESILPSWQSLRSNAPPAMLEEERRNCFVAITRTKRQLTLCWAKRYGQWHKDRSRFLGEMGLDA
jgi:DNA helicase-2/ATP-dependent DNA helicase PcrA